MDCGAQQGIDNIVAGVAAAGVAPEELQWIIVTHAHMDHAGAAGNLLQIFPQAKLAAHSAALRHLINPPDKLIPAAQNLFGKHYYDEQYEGIVAADESRTHAIDEGDELMVGDLRLQVLYTPGHAWHHVTLHDIENGVLYTGDAYGVSYLPPAADGGLLVMPVMPPTHFSPKESVESLRRLRDVGAGHIALTHFDVIENRPAYADMQIAALEEWTQTAHDMQNGAFVESFLPYLREWYQKQAAALGLDADETVRLHEHDCILTAKGFAYWLQKMQG